MNTHDIDIELPQGYAERPFDYSGDLYIEGQVRAIIKADRERRGEPVGYIMPTALKQLKAGGNAIVGGVSQGFDVPIYTAPQPDECRGEPVAYMFADEWGRTKIVLGKETAEHWCPPDENITPLYAAPQPAEPEKVPSDADAKHVQDFINCDGMGAVIVEGPQYSAVVRALLARYAAEPSRSPTLRKADSRAQNKTHAP